MEFSQERVLTERLSYWRVFRLILVLFSLYLLGDAFYRWDGFKYYSSFQEFLPGLALIIIFWSIMAALTAFLFFLPLRLLEWFCLLKNIKIRIEHLLVFVFFLFLSGTAVWRAKILILQYAKTSIELKLAVLLSVVIISLLFTWLSRNKAEQWVDAIHERITPLVWLFCTLLIDNVQDIVHKNNGHDIVHLKL